MIVVLAIAGGFAAQHAGPTRARMEYRLTVPGITRDGNGGELSPARSFAMGFTPFPYAFSTEAIETVRRYLRTDADLIVMHFDSGVPWVEAAAGSPYPASFVAEVEDTLKMAAAHHFRLLQFTPLDFFRANLAPFVSNQPLTPPWDGYALDDPRVISAYLHHARWLIAKTDPEYVNYGVEVNMLRQNSPEKWAAYLRFLGAVYPVLKAEFPEIPFFLSIQADFFHTQPGQAAAAREMLEYSDFVAVSTYPFSASTLAALKADWFSEIAALAPGKRFAISETGWPAEDETPPSVVLTSSDPAIQDGYMRRLLNECDALRCVFINWFVIRDYDQLWEEQLKALPLAGLYRIWRDVGVYDGEGNARPAWLTWREWLRRPLRR